jgi:hypothetical protein
LPYCLLRKEKPPLVTYAVSKKLCALYQYFLNYSGQITLALNFRTTPSKWICPGEPQKILEFVYGEANKWTSRRKDRSFYY